MSGTVLGDTVSMPGFEGRVVGLFAGRTVIDGRLRGQIPAHKAETDEMVLVLSGELVLSLDGLERIYVRSDYVVIPAGTEHLVRSEHECRLLLIG